MDQEQEVSIPLSKYLQLKEIEEHAKEVKITEEYKTICGEITQLGTSVSWKSDGKCWVFLASKLNSAGMKFKELRNDYDKIKKMSVKEFKIFKKSLNKRW